MKILQYLICVALALNLIACATTSEVGGESGFEKLFQSKRYKLTVKERDSLLAVTRQLQTDTTRLGNQTKSLQLQIRKLNGDYSFLKKNYTVLDSQYTTLNGQYTILKNEQVKLRNQYKFYSDSVEKRLSELSGELRSKTDSLNTKFYELNSRTNELNSKTVELNSKSDELNSKNEQLKSRNDQTKSDQLPQKAEQLALMSDQVSAPKSNQGNNNEKPLVAGNQALRTPETRIEGQDSSTGELYNTIKKALIPFTADAVTVRMVNKKINVSMPNKFLFIPGSMSIEDNARKALKKLSVILNHYENIEISVEGHTDNTPVKNTQYRDNRDLSVIRASAVVRIMVDEYDVSPTKISASGRGEFLPVASNESVEGRAKNRRIEIIISPI